MSTRARAGRRSGPRLVVLLILLTPLAPAGRHDDIAEVSIRDLIRARLDVETSYAPRLLNRRTPLEIDVAYESDDQLRSGGGQQQPLPRREAPPRSEWALVANVVGARDSLALAVDIEPDLAKRPPVVLTFDTEIPYGAEARRTLLEILDALRAARARATFFVVGRWARANPDLLRRLVADGHEVANHSFSHAPFSGGSPARLTAELDEVAEIVERETGTPIAPFFRPPYGCLDPVGHDVVQRNGYRLVGWTAIGRDARGRTRSAAEVVASVEPALHPGAVVLFHTSRWITAAALPEILRLIEERDLRAVPISELLSWQATKATEVGEPHFHPCPSHPIQPLIARRGTQMLAKR